MCLAAAGRIALYYIEFVGLTFCILGAAHDQNSANFFGEPDGDWFAAYLCNQDGKGGLIMSGSRNDLPYSATSLSRSIADCAICFRFAAAV